MIAELWNSFLASDTIWYWIGIIVNLIEYSLACYLAKKNNHKFVFYFFITLFVIGWFIGLPFANSFPLIYFVYLIGRGIFRKLFTKN